ncbi:Gfo/Idh/MocA family oxidoreductase [Iamia sp. SCSIO 61187]|uniref:Gfo/Idh/MocA family protein n=1 Tax=Iamia sp. SCSIO 61187 TaxID=2722752 RepID=UPI001C6375C7|nr:Gfo/Idh/MocA family oxidoreductase [Iamia sp. SCSIO 61187]QYG91996.1 Gfo/Idh/MocA family oxidoreductase [Iamia sp. SCSIO 61187]
MSDDIRWGIAGPGRIATGVALDLALVPGARLVAVGSRSQERAAAFAAQHATGGDRARTHGSYRALLDDPDVDVVYVATPHPQHHAIALAAIAAGKHVLVEKAFTATLAGSREVVAAARAAGVFAMEAMWTRFHPAVVRVRELLAEGAIGEVRSVQADLGIAAPADPTNRFFAPELGGGGLLDLGVYVVALAHMVLGPPTEVIARGTLTATGVDAEAALLLVHEGGATATLTCSILSPSVGRARIDGTAGSIELKPRFHHPHGFTLRRLGVEPQRIDLPPTGIGYSHELVEVTEAVRAGRTESAVMPLAHTLEVMAVLEEAGRQLGVTPWAEDATVAV